MGIQELRTLGENSRPFTVQRGNSSPEGQWQLTKSKEMNGVESYSFSLQMKCLILATVWSLSLSVVGVKTSALLPHCCLQLQRETMYRVLDTFINGTVLVFPTLGDLATLHLGAMQCLRDTVSFCPVIRPDLQTTSYVKLRNNLDCPRWKQPEVP